MNSDNEIWVFLSHSNKDYEKVIKVRDLLEKNSFRPLMLFLKCLNDDDEIDDLIKREIDSRGRFILCDSENARNSAWVQREIGYIKSKNRIFQTIDIDAPIEVVQKQVEQFYKRNSVFISYNVTSERDASLADKLKLRLTEKQFGVHLPQNFTREDDLEDLKQYHAVTYSVVAHETLIVILSDDWGYNELKDIYSPIKNSIQENKNNIYLCVLSQIYEGLVDKTIPVGLCKQGRIFNFINKEISDDDIISVVDTIYEDVMSSNK